MWGGGGMWVRSDVTSGHNWRWEWRPDAGDAEDEKTTSDAPGRGARASDAGLTFADVDARPLCGSTLPPPWDPVLLYLMFHGMSPGLILWTIGSSVGEAANVLTPAKIAVIFKEH